MWCLPLLIKESIRVKMGYPVQSQSGHTVSRILKSSSFGKVLLAVFLLFVFSYVNLRLFFYALLHRRRSLLESVEASMKRQ